MIFRLCVFLAFLMTVDATEYFVATNGTIGNPGTFNLPWTLGKALTNGSVVGGDTIWIRGGTYTGSWSTDPFGAGATLNGANGNPIIVRNYSGERAVIDGRLIVNNTNCWFWGLELTINDPMIPLTLTRDEQDIAINAGTYKTGGLDFSAGKNTKLINCLIRDCYKSSSFGQTAQDCELYGCIFVNNGRDSANYSSGHGLYAQNLASYKWITNCIFQNNYLSGLNLYSSGGTGMSNLIAGGNCVIGNGYGFPPSPNVLASSDVGIQNLSLVENFVANWPIQTNPNLQPANFNIGYGGAIVTNALVYSNYSLFGSFSLAQSTNHVVTNNVIIAYGLLVQYLGSGTINGNTYASAYSLPFNLNGSNESWAAWQAGGFDPDSTFTPSLPTNGSIVVVRTNTYESGRGHVFVMNWASNSTVLVDISSLGLAVGQRFKIQAIQDIYGTPVTGVYQGTNVAIPMTGWGLTKPRSRAAAMVDATWLAAHPTAYDVTSTYPLAGTFLITRFDGLVANISTLRVGTLRGP